eukprot:TRINITY_DN1408_c0_g1_i1.p1 TRINITY_DN1408_c0_g1~~TRINITY_DN1408_c0_g1_i1.p1  ORF type:complete len:294 (+),score=61.48 TRINITY_DN1408_c0_g1_i1:159-1040(+)
MATLMKPIFGQCNSVHQDSTVNPCVKWVQFGNHPCRSKTSKWKVHTSSAVTASEEPKWKQKLAAADDHAEQTRQRTAQAQEEYRARQAALRLRDSDPSVVPLDQLPFLPFLDDDGKVTDISEPTAKASVYAIYNDRQELQYVGVSRQVYQSLRMHLARSPAECVWVKAQHVTKPSRVALENIRSTWVTQNNAPIPGNDNGPVQERWENAIDCKPLMTDAEKLAFEEAAPGPPKAKVLKNVARRVEKELMSVYEARNITESFRFEPKLKDRGLLDLKTVVASKPDTTVPASTPN